MPSPFPGMDPYLEERELWPDVHLSLITAIRDALAPQVAPHYYVRIERRTYMVQVDREALVRRPDAAVIATSPPAGRPAEAGVATALARATQSVLLPAFEEIREAYLEIHDDRTHEVVTAIELLSPTNKAAGQGRLEYQRKRNQILHSLTSLVEIDLLRGGEPMEMEPSPPSDYRIVVGPEWERPWARLHAFSLREPIPELSLPLRPGEPEPLLALGDLLNAVYDRARYDLSIDYRLPPPEPLLSADDMAWMSERLHPLRLEG
jgi:uncharacterized protein DUF4058